MNAPAALWVGIACAVVGAVVGAVLAAALPRLWIHGDQLDDAHEHRLRRVERDVTEIHAGISEIREIVARLDERTAARPMAGGW